MNRRRRSPRADSPLWLPHGRVTLALHALRNGSGTPLLLLHALYGSHADWDSSVQSWPGPVYALDFSGHGRSRPLKGGGYYPELLAADADIALGRIGSAAVAGAGLGAYVALLLAGGRPELVPGALLLPGAGLVGGGAMPDPQRDGQWLTVQSTDTRAAGSHDPRVRVLERYVRPPEYVQPFAVQARKILLADGVEEPPWWTAVAAASGAERVPCDLPLALARLASVAA